MRFPVAGGIPSNLDRVIKANKCGETIGADYQRSLKGAPGEPRHREVRSPSGNASSILPIIRYGAHLGQVGWILLLAPRMHATAAFVCSGQIIMRF